MNNELGAAVILTAALLILPTARAQTQPAASTQQPSPTSVGAYDWFGQVGLVCGGGASYATAAVEPTVQCGGIFSFPFFDLEAGVMGPQATHSAVSGYLSTNLWFPLAKPASKRGFPLVVGGYTRMFEAGSALDYGVAYAYPLDDCHSIQFEARDYWIVKDPQQHNIVFRVAWLVGLPD